MENQEDKKITFLAESIHRMVAHASRNPQWKFEVKEGFLERFWVKWQWNGKKEFLRIFINFLLFPLIFYAFYLKPKVLMIL
jgi:hypothetical protein